MHDVKSVRLARFLAVFVIDKKKSPEASASLFMDAKKTNRETRSNILPTLKMSDRDIGADGVPLLEPSPTPEPQSTQKRKRAAESEAQPTSKRAAKRKKTKAPKDIDDEALDADAGVNNALAHMDSQLLSDHLLQRTRRFNNDLSIVELEDLTLPSTAITDTTSFSNPRTTDHLPSFLETFGSRAGGPGSTNPQKKKRTLAQAPKEKGSPHTLIIAGAGLRAADLTRALRSFQSKESMVAKLFAKHIKLKEAVEMCGKTRMGIGVGTPQRLIDLLEAGGEGKGAEGGGKKAGSAALSLKRLERVVVDASHIDQKKRGILDMKETQGPLMRFLGTKELRERYGDGEGRVQLLFF